MRRTGLCRVALVLIYGAFCVVGCERKGEINRGIAAEIRRSCVGAPNCKIAVKQITRFDWDKLYVFSSQMNESERSKVLGVKDDGFQELQQQLVFTKNGAVVYEESELADIETPSRDEVLFDRAVEQRYEAFGHDATFEAAIVDGSASRYYTLRQIQ